MSASYHVGSCPATPECEDMASEPEVIEVPVVRMTVEPAPPPLPAPKWIWVPNKRIVGSSPQSQCCGGGC
eukprot:1936606-Amphidinium_carterae.1